MKSTRLPQLISLGILALVAAAPLASAQQKTLTLTFGVYPTDKATVMYRTFTPMIDELEDRVAKRLNQPVDIHLTIFRSYEDGIDALCKGTVDFVHFGPASSIVAKQRAPGIKLLAMEHENGEKRFQGVIFVGKDSPIHTLADLKGKRFAFGDPNSTIGRWLVQAELVKAGVVADDLASFKYLERHDQVADVVVHGDFDAGSVKMSTFQKANAKSELRSIATFENVTKPVVAREGLDQPVFEAIQSALIEMKEPALFKDLKISGFMSTSDAEYDFVREGMKRAAAFEGRRGG